MEPLYGEVLITAGFLAVLIAAWAAIRYFRAPLAERLQQARPVTCVGATALGTDARAFLLEAEGQRLLVVSQKRGAVAITPLGPAPEVAA